MDSKLNFLHVCDYASSGDSGKLNILGIFENIYTKTVPYTHPQLYIVSNIGIGKSGNYKQIIKIIRKTDGQEIIAPLEFNLAISQLPANGVAKVGVIGQLNNIKFEVLGNYIIQVFIDADKIGEKEFEVNQIPIK